ncbi:hypothetical protein DITRI_Ditri16bG0132400 [Diplodiscus trichospermus]
MATLEDLRFESPLKLVEYPDPILRKSNKRIDTFDENLKQLVDEMFNVMYKTNGIGLSASQVGINVQLMVFNPVGKRGEGQETVLVNPELCYIQRRHCRFMTVAYLYQEYMLMLRPESVKIDAQDINGARFTVDLSGLPARVFQHEFDHLRGILFFDRVTNEILGSIRAQLEALEKKYEDKTGLPSPEKIETRERKNACVGFGKIMNV